MAYAALVSLTQTLDLILNHPTYSITTQEKNQIIHVKDYIILLQEFLEDFPVKASSFEGRMRELIQGAEEILSLSLLGHIQQPHYASLDSSAGSSNSTSQYHRYKSYDQLNKVTKEIELIAEKVMEIKCSFSDKDERVGDSTRVASSSSRAAPVHNEAMVGLDNNLMEVKLRLCRDSSKLEILPIVGMGGIGKTTLARNVYDDPLIMDRFDIRAWVTVSQDYRFQEIVSSLLVSMGGTLTRNVNKNDQIGSWDTVSQNDVQEITENQPVEQHNVHQHLKGRRYLIVIDDIWSTEAWDELKLMFPDDGNGSRIMLTTRLSNVATYAGSVHDMRLMDDDESWNLLQQKVFQQDSCPQELEYIGKKIARSCRGLPLAVVVISGLLVADQTEAAWENIAQDVKAAISANDEQFDRILSLSYTHLPHHLRSCFLYMGGFPEDHEMRVSTLIKLWIAEGFLKPNGCKTSEETAEEYLEDLVRRNLFLVTARKSNGRTKFLGMHDLLREMCRRKAREENFILHFSGILQQGTRISRCVSTTDSDLNFLENVDCSTIRTILLLRNTSERCSLSSFKLLRILAVSDDKDYSAQVSELFHLRYLAFDSPFCTWPSLSFLQDLQTLIICPMKNHYTVGYSRPIIRELPMELWRMPQLRHVLSYRGFLPFQEAAEYPLENLQTLSGVVDFVCSRKILKMVPNLKKLGLTYYTRQGLEEDYMLHNIKYMRQLETLKIVVNGVYDRPTLSPAFPRTLKKLSLQKLKLSWWDMSVVASLPRLEVLKLRCLACVGSKWETADGGFPQLKFLLIERSGLQQWTTESSHFPRLNFLVLHHCWRLREIPDGIGEIPTLELIEVDDWDKSLVRSAKQIQDDQQSCGNDAFQLRILKVKLLAYKHGRKNRKSVVGRVSTA